MPAPGGAEGAVRRDLRRAAQAWPEPRPPALPSRGTPVNQKIGINTRLDGIADGDPETIARTRLDDMNGHGSAARTIAAARVAPRRSMGLLSGTG
jgi:hypothetical protein